MTKIASEILAVSSAIERLMRQGHGQEAIDPTSAGITDFDEIVRDFVAAGEWGCAVHHLAYVVDELDLTLEGPQQSKFDSLRRSLGE